MAEMREAIEQRPLALDVKGLGAMLGNSERTIRSMDASERLPLTET